jgi:hypothetical protein
VVANALFFFATVCPKKNKVATSTKPVAPSNIRLFTIKFNLNGLVVGS